MKRTILSLVLAALGGIMAFAADPSVLYMIGGAIDKDWKWDTAAEMQPVSGQEGVYSWTGYLSSSNGGELKISPVNAWNNQSFYRPSQANCAISKAGVANSAVIYTPDRDGDNKWKVTDAGVYTITLDIKNLTISATYLGAPLYMIGGATPGGWDWNKATLMIPVPGHEGEYSWTGNLIAGDFKISPNKNFDDPFYRPTYANCEISKDGVVDNKVVYTTNPDDKWLVKDAGKYTITINTKDLTLSAVFEGFEGLYLIGDAAPCGWNISSLTSCEKKDNKVFVYNGVLKAGFLQASPTQGDWNAQFIVPKNSTPLSQPDGNIKEVCEIPESGLINSAFDYTTDHSKAWRVEKEGNYTLTFDLNNWTLTVSNNVDTSVVELVTDNDAPVEYYNLQGVRVYQPANGLYLKRQGNKVSKVMIK